MVCKAVLEGPLRKARAGHALPRVTGAGKGLAEERDLGTLGWARDSKGPAYLASLPPNP